MSPSLRVGHAFVMRAAAGDDPCWQNIYDDDCSMSSIYAASFVAGDWIKSMPCGQGLEVRILDCCT